MPSADAAPGAVKPAPHLRVLTVNIHKGFTFLNRRFMLRELRDAVRAVGADLVMLQEVQGEHLVHSSRVSGWPAQPHHEFLADSIWSDHAYARNAVYTHGHHGNAVLSKYPIEAWDNYPLPVDGQEPRGLLHCRVRLPDAGMTVHAMCVHLGVREHHRPRQLREMVALVERHVPADAPLVVAGDFNDWRLRAPRVLGAGAGLRDLHQQALRRPLRTFPAAFPLLALDRIYVRGFRGGKPLLLPRRPWARLSDHSPVAVDLQP